VVLMGSDGREKSVVVAGGWLEKELTVERERNMRSVVGKRKTKKNLVEREISMSDMRAMMRGGRNKGREKAVKGEEKERKLSSK